MRTTVDIPDPLYRRLKAAAAQQGCSVKSLLLGAAERVLQETRPRKRVQLPLIESKRPGSLRLDNAKVHELIDFP